MDSEKQLKPTTERDLTLGMEKGIGEFAVEGAMVTGIHVTGEGTVAP